jgi:hypothetical protein
MLMSSSGRKIRWGIEQRLEFIEFRLFWEGGINRGDLTEQFGVSVPQASNDLRRYSEAAPGNLVYDKSLKKFFASTTFQPKFFVPDADLYLSRLRAAATKSRTGEVDAWFSQIPAAESMPLPHRRVDVEVLRRLLESIRRRRSLQILYQSMNSKRPTAMWRWMSPHAFANDGLRWHVRAYCYLEERFRDFVLPRCLKAGDDRPQDVSSESDRNWHEFFGVVLIPNPKLSPSQQKVVAQDFRMEGGSISIAVRRSFLYYFQKRLRLDVGPILDDPRETPVVVKNLQAFSKAIVDAK